MRCAALLGLVGCNSWFGLNPTREVGDAPPMFASAQVVYQVATTDATGAPRDPLYAPIEGVRISIGPMAGPLTDVVPDAMGAIAVPAELAAAPWRLAYQIGSGVTVEYQWQPSHAVICVPRFGRLERTPVAGTDTVRMAPSNIAAYVAPRLMTSGVWTETVLPKPPGTLPGEVSFAFMNALALDGPLGQISGSAGDWEMVVDYSSNNGSTAAYGYARTPASLTDPAMQVGFQQPSPVMVKDQLLGLTALNLFTAGLGNLAAGGTMLAHAAIGFVPSGALPPFVQRTGADEVPLLLDFTRFDGADLPSSFMAIDPDVPEPRAVYLRRTLRRMTGALALDSAIERVDLGTSAAYPSGASDAIGVGIASAVTLDGIDLLAADGTSVPAGSAPHTLAFAIAMGPADDAVVTLSRVDGAGLVPLRRFVTVGTSIAIDPALLAPGSTYVFDLELRKGYPDAHLGDYRAVAYPFADTRIFAATFTVH